MFSWSWHLATVQLASILGLRVITTVHTAEEATYLEGHACNTRAAVMCGYCLLLLLISLSMIVILSPLSILLLFSLYDPDLNMKLARIVNLSSTDLFEAVIDYSNR